MPVQRKIFRIEQDAHAAGRGEVSARDAEAALRHHEFMAEIKALRGLIEPRAETNREAMETARAQISEAQSYKAELETIHAALKRSREEVAAFAGGGALPPDIARASRELDAIVRGTEQATQHLLQAAEDIDQCANTLSAALKSEHEKGLANDIRDRVVQIFEACNFQDLTGQRVGKVVETLAFLEEHVERLMEIWSKASSNSSRSCSTRRPRATRNSSTGRSSPATPVTPRRTTSTRCSTAD